MAKTGERYATARHHILGDAPVGDAKTRTAAVRQSWRRLDALARSAQERFPLSDSAAADLRGDLQRRVLALHDAEVAAHAAVSAVLAGWR